MSPDATSQGLTRFFVVTLTVLLSSSAAFAQSADQRARAHLVEGQRLFERGEYSKAIEELTAGNVIEPQARMYYALGQAYRLNHQCFEAVQAYRTFLAMSPAPSQARAAAQLIRKCGEEDPASLRDVGAAPTPTATPAPVPTPSVAPTPAPAPLTTITEAPSPASRPVYRKWWLWTTVGVVVAAGVGVGLGVGLTRGAPKFDATVPGFGPAAPTAAAFHGSF